MSTLTFNKITVRNFLSYGNIETSIVLNDSGLNLIMGKNGSGKSCLILDAVFVALYNKPFRKINKPNVVNSINMKEMEVTLELEMYGKNIVIKRGIDPNFLKVFVDDEPHSLNNDTDGRIQQKKLESLIRIKKETLRQLILLGSAKYSTFMELESKERSVILEQIFDVDIFSKMSKVLEQRIIENKMACQDVANMLQTKKTELSTASWSLKSLLEVQENVISNIDSLLQQHETNITNISTQMTEKENALSGYTYTDIGYFDNKITDIVNKYNKVKLVYSTKQKTQRYLEVHSDCEMCGQHIDDEFKNKTLESIEGYIGKADTFFEQYKKAYDKLTKEKQLAITNNETIEKIQFEISRLQSDLEKEQRQITELTNQKENTNITVKINEANYKIEKIQKEICAIEENSSHLEKYKKGYSICKTLLKEDGIKAAILKEWLPILNQQINRYLTLLGSTFSFELNENFDEVIKSRYRDSFNYQSFSEGQKKRIDFAIMLAFRDVARMKNSIDSSLLVLDDIVNGTMDQDGLLSFMELLRTEKIAKSIFVLAPAMENVDYFDKVYQVEMKQNFSQLSVL